MHREPHLLIADDDPRVIDYYRLALGLPATPEEQDTDQELDEMFSLLEGEDPLQEHAPSHCRAVTVSQGLDALRVFGLAPRKGMGLIFPNQDVDTVW